MAQTKDDNFGALFVNKKKQNARYPDFTGKIKCDGKEYYISAWWKKGMGGEWISLAVRDFVPRESEIAGNSIESGDSLKW